MKVLKKFFLLILLVLFVPICSVDAEEEIRTVTVDGTNYYYYDDVASSNYGNYAGESPVSGAGSYTKEKNVNSNPTFCVEASSHAPANGAQYSEIFWGEVVDGKTWNESTALMAGCIIKVTDDALSGGDYIVSTYATLNSYFGFSRSINFAAVNPRISGFLQKANAEYAKLKLSSELPSFNATAVKNVLEKRGTGSDVYYVGAFKLSNLIANYGGDHIHGDDQVTYDIKLPTGVTLCTDANCTSVNNKLQYTSISGEKTFYIKATSFNPGDDFQITVNASNSSDYLIGRLWEPVVGDTQMLVAKWYKNYPRTAKASVNFSIPEYDNKTIKLFKKDAATGEYLKGANIKLQLSGGSTTSCTVPSNGYSCTITLTEDLLENTYFSITETSAPNGYIKGKNIPNIKWDLNSDSNVCYVSDGVKIEKTDMNDCDRIYRFGKICTNNGKSVAGNCSVNESGKISGTESTVCYYESNGANIVDDSKCSNKSTFVKVTNSSGNLVIEYYNKKNHVEISKVSISGNEEILGAELKVCSNKPDSSGKCNVVKNTLVGQCSSSDDSNFQSDVNCKNNDDGTKTVDMQWVSGSSSKIWNGISAGTYYLVETVAPTGYLPLTSYIEFKIAADGTVTSSSYDSKTNKLLVKNKPTSFKVTKKDSSNDKNLVGATLGICSAYTNENGDYTINVDESGFCTPVILANGDNAVWDTTDKSKSISGLAIGTYYLVELKAPEGYSTAEPILFTLKSDGTIVDKDGKAIKDNTIVMEDKKIENPKTSGNPPLMYVVIGGSVLVLLCGLGYYCLVKKNGIEIIKNKFKKNKK